MDRAVITKNKNAFNVHPFYWYDIKFDDGSTAIINATEETICRLSNTTQISFKVEDILQPV